MSNLYSLINNICNCRYNITKVARANILRYFNQIFDGLCKLFAHVDMDVKNGANQLDRLIKVSTMIVKKKLSVGK